MKRIAKKYLNSWQRKTDLQTRWKISNSRLTLSSLVLFLHETGYFEEATWSQSYLLRNKCQAMNILLITGDTINFAQIIDAKKFGTRTFELSNFVWKHRISRIRIWAIKYLQSYDLDKQNSVFRHLSVYLLNRANKINLRKMDTTEMLFTQSCWNLRRSK